MGFVEVLLLLLIIIGLFISPLRIRTILIKEHQSSGVLKVVCNVFIAMTFIIGTMSILAIVN